MPAVRCSHASTTSTPATLCGSAEDVSLQAYLFCQLTRLGPSSVNTPALQTLCWSCSGLTLLCPAKSSTEQKVVNRRGNRGVQQGEDRYRVHNCYALTAASSCSMHRMAGAALCFWSALVLELGAVSFFTFWGLRWQLPQLHSLRDWADAYSWSDGCLDVWLQSVAHCALLAVHMLCMAGRMSKRVTALRSHKRARTFVWAVTSGCQACLPLRGSVRLSCGSPACPASASASVCRCCCWPRL